MVNWTDDDGTGCGSEPKKRKQKILICLYCTNNQASYFLAYQFFLTVRIHRVFHIVLAELTVCVRKVRNVNNLLGCSGVGRLTSYFEKAIIEST